MIQLFSMWTRAYAQRSIPLEGIDLSIIYIYAGARARVGIRVPAVAARHGLRCPLPKLRLAAGLLKVRARAGLLTEGESIQRGAPSGQ